MQARDARQKWYRSSVGAVITMSRERMQRADPLVEPIAIVTAQSDPHNQSWEFQLWQCCASEGRPIGYYSLSEQANTGAPA